MKEMSELSWPTLQLFSGNVFCMVIFKRSETIDWKQKKNVDCCIVTWPKWPGGQSHTFKAPFRKEDVDHFLSDIKMNLDDLNDHAELKLLPLNKTNPLDKKDTEKAPKRVTNLPRIVDPRLEYVQYWHPSDPSSYFNTENVQDDKGYAVVVSGESGSGKSVFACKQSMESGYFPVYCLVKKEHLKDKPDLSEYRALNSYFEKLIIENKANVTLVNRLYELKFKLNESRNTWAKRVLQELMTAFIDGGNKHIHAWADGRWDHSYRPTKVAIIVDEATDIDLAEGLIATVRETMKLYQNLAQNHILLVVAGVGLDAIKDVDGTYSGRVGTNPAYSKLVVMKSPDINQLSLSPEVKVALEQGVLARVFKTNTRMFFRSVLYILSMDMHAIDAEFTDQDKKRRRLENRLVKIGSFSDIMDHGPRYYVHWNSVRDLTADNRFRLLLQAFAYHVVEAVEKVNAHTSVDEKINETLSLIQNLDVYKKITSEPFENIFSRGLACRRGTSNALKYMSTFGLTCTLRPSFGNEFEELTALHYMRVMELQGYETRRITLKYAWPPKKTKKKWSNALDDLDSILQSQSEDECSDDASCNILNDLPDNGKICIVFSQGTPTAQGGDVLFLLLDFKKEIFKLESMQCKHWADQPPEKKCRSWWNSVGVSLKSDGTADFKPTSGSAAYSYKGLEAFRKLLCAKVSHPGDHDGKKVDVKLGMRSLAMSFATPTEKTFPIPASGDTRVWFREMFEPTISVFKEELRKPVPVDEDDVDGTDDDQ